MVQMGSTEFWRKNIPEAQEKMKACFSKNYCICKDAQWSQIFQFFSPNLLNSITHKGSLSNFWSSSLVHIPDTNLGRWTMTNGLVTPRAGGFSPHPHKADSGMMPDCRRFTGSVFGTNLCARDGWEAGWAEGGIGYKELCCWDGPSQLP